MDGRVINFGKVREAKIEERRRKYERILFKQLLGVYCVAEGEGLRAVELVDVSAEGLSFQLPRSSKQVDNYEMAQTPAFRFYFSQDTFITVTTTIVNQRDCVENGEHYVRFGCTVDKTSQSYEAYKLFVEFLTKYAEVSQQDKGDLKIFFF